MVLEDELRLKVTARLFKDRARVWWESLKGRSNVALSWSNFQKEFMQLSQGSRYVTNYETELKGLINFIPELVDFE